MPTRSMASTWTSARVAGGWRRAELSQTLAAEVAALEAARRAPKSPGISREISNTEGWELDLYTHLYTHYVVSGIRAVYPLYTLCAVYPLYTP